MKTFLHSIIALSIFFSINEKAKSANELFRSIATGNWNANSTWEMSTNGGGAWFAATSTPRDTSGAITIRNPNTVTVTVNTTANQLTIDSGGVLTVNAGIFLTITAGSGNDVTINNGGITNGPGTFRTQGTIEFNLRGGSAFNANLNVNTGSVTAHDQSSPYFGSIFGNVSVDAGTTINGGPISSRGLGIYGNISNSGTITATSSGGYLVMDGDSIVNNGVITSAGTLYLDSTTAISGAGTFTAAGTSISGNIKLLSNITYSPATYLTINSGGVLNPNGNTLTFTSGSVYVSSGATVSASGLIRTQNIVALYPRAGSAFNAPVNVNTGTTYSYDDLSPYDGSLFGDVTVDAGATLNCGNISGRHLYMYGNVLNNGTITASSSGGSYSINGLTLINNGTITTPGTIYFQDTTSISGSGLFTAAGTSISGNIKLLSNITYSPATYLTINSGGVLNPNGNTFTITSGSVYVSSGATVSASGLIRTQNIVGLFPRAGSAFNAPVNVNTGTTYSYDDLSPYDGSLFGDVTVDAGATLNGGNISGRSIYFYGNVINNGTLTTSSSGGSIRIKGPSLDNNGVINHAGSFYFDTTTSLTGSGSFTSHANLFGNANVTLNSKHQMSSVTINTGTLFNISNQWLKLSASNPIGVSGTFNTTNSTVEYNGAVTQTVSTTGITYSKLRINNSSGTGLANNVAVNDSLIIQLGYLDLSGKVLTISSTGSLLETPGNLVIGATGYLTTTRTINAPSSLNVAGFGAVLTTTANLGSTEIRRGHGVQTGGSIKRYFDITPTNNSGLNATLKFKYDQSELNLRPEAALKLFKSTNGGISFTNMGGTVNTSLNEITISGLSSFSRWTADSSGVNGVFNFAIEGFYNSSTNRLNMTDTVRIYLRQVISPYAAVDSSITLLDSALLKAACHFPNAVTGTYYIQIRHRNALETWSKSGGESYIAGNTLNYNFYTAANTAFGSNQAQVDASPVRFGLYAGDENQDGTVDATDIVDIYNDVQQGIEGYVPTDVNGDDFVDASDIIIAYNNANLIVSVITP